MATRTPKYQLVLHEATDQISRTAINENTTKTEAALDGLAQNISSVEQNMIELGSSLQKINDAIEDIQADIELLRPERQGLHHVTFAGISAGTAYGSLTLPSASRYAVTAIQMVNVGNLSASDWSVTTSGNTILIIAEHPSIAARSAYSANVYLAFS